MISKLGPAVTFNSVVARRALPLHKRFEILKRNCMVQSTRLNYLESRLALRIIKLYETEDSLTSNSGAWI
jgi:hypothetical protein